MGFSSALCDSFKEDAVGEAVLWGKKKKTLSLGSFFFLQDLAPGKWLQCVKSQYS